MNNMLCNENGINLCCFIKHIQYYVCRFYVMRRSNVADMGELLVNQSVIALVNGEAWDMHRPLVDDCELRFQHFRDENPHLSNLVRVSIVSLNNFQLLDKALNTLHV